MQFVIDIPNATIEAYQDLYYKIHGMAASEGLFDDKVKSQRALALKVVLDVLEGVVNGTPLPKGHGRLIDADAFIPLLEDASKRNKYKELLIDDCLTVDDVFKAVIKSLQNRGLTKYNAPTIIEADKGEENADSEEKI